MGLKLAELSSVFEAWEVFCVVMNLKHYLIFCFLTILFISGSLLWVLKKCSCVTEANPEYQRVVSSPQIKSEKQAKSSLVSAHNGSNILVIYTGRWKFLRILLAHVYRELRSNGGILDQVWFVLIRFDATTMSKLKEFIEAANEFEKKLVFSIHDQGYRHGDYTHPYYEIFSHLIRFPSDRFFKFDDDIVYIRPRAFNMLVDKRDNSRCFMHFFNIAGSNWRCSWLHQKKGVYEETNPENLRFQYHPNGYCGWQSPECGELTIRTFLHHYKRSQIDKFCFKDLELLTDRKRFSINAFMLDKNLIDVKAMLDIGKIYSDDEKWWTEAYSARVLHPNCIVGDALVVHFAYNTVIKNMLSQGLLEEFVKIVEDNRASFRIQDALWKLLDF